MPVSRWWPKRTYSPGAPDMLRVDPLAIFCYSGWKPHCAMSSNTADVTYRSIRQWATHAAPDTEC